MPLGRESTFVRIRDALGWRLRRRVGDAPVDRALVVLAGAWRPVLRRPLFVGIAGSAGKTTAKELLGGILSSRRFGVTNPGTMNMVAEVAKTILGVRPWHDFCVAEISEDRPGAMDEPLALFGPRIGIVTVVGDDHASAYESRQAVASEVGKLVSSLPADGVAVLNADDELVRSMSERCAGRVILYGRGEAAQLRASEVEASWPDRLTFTVEYEGARERVRTRMCGEHWVVSVLGAMGGGLAAGLTLGQCVRGVEGVEAFEGRMQAVKSADGVTYIRDDFKAPLWGLGTSLEFVRRARARRKVVVIGTLSDLGTGTGAAQKYAKVAREVQAVADEAVFVGPWSSSVLKAREAGREEALKVFGRVEEAARYVNAVVGEGDLVLLKGTNKQDHLMRIVLARSGEIACWRDECKRDVFCGQCPQRMKASDEEGPGEGAGQAGQGRADGGVPSVGLQAQGAEPPRLGADEVVIVGLGNPQAGYAGTPHNVGYEVVEGLARQFDLQWRETARGWMARGQVGGRGVCLLKVRAEMNRTGPVLRQMAEAMGFGPGQCVLVQDDLSLPLGVVKTRQAGGAGGHKGVASVLEAFQSDGFRRVKVGVGSAGAQVDRVRYVLSPFDDESRGVLREALLVAADRIEALAGIRLSGPVVSLTGGAPARTD